MTTVDTSNPVLTHASPERRQPLWPWLVMPLAALTLFFALRSVRDIPPSRGSTATSSESRADDDGSGTP